jgi:hypothetical protein
MALAANGAKLQWYAYEYGVQHHDGKVVKLGTPEEALKMVRNFGGKPVFRAVYTTEWMDADAL